jgi:hypothetical protein
VTTRASPAFGYDAHVKHSSDILLHFVDRLHREDAAAQRDTCMRILSQGFKFTIQKVMFGATIGGDPYGITALKAVCFTDIPLRMAQAHVARYGKCAIGVRKSLVKQWGGNPVLYLVDRFSTESMKPIPARTSFRGGFGSSLAGLFRNLTSSREVLERELPPGHWALALNEEQRTQLSDDVSWPLMAHTKEMFDLGEDVDGEDDAEARRDRYYMEREWRVCLTRAHEQTAQPGGSHLVTQNGGDFFLPLRHSDVRVIVVPNDKIRADLATTLLVEGWPAAELPTLITFDESADL